MSLTNLPAEKPYIVCAFYTDGYVREVQSLEASLKAHGIPHLLRRFESRGVWEANTRIKPEFLRDCLAEHPGKDVVYIDADAVVRAPLTLFDAFEADIGVFVAPEGGGFSHRYLTGTLYLRNTPQVRAFVDSWIAAQGGMLLGVDQDSFTTAIAQHPALRLEPLPASYVKIHDRGSDTPVIEHFQASRTRVKLQRVLKKARNSALALVVLAIAAWLGSRWL